MTSRSKRNESRAEGGGGNEEGKSQSHGNFLSVQYLPQHLHTTHNTQHLHWILTLDTLKH